MSHTADLAVERLYRSHRSELYRWLLRETGDPEVAEDVLQTAFLHAHRALLRGKPPREPRSWLFAIARNANRRRLQRHRFPEAEFAEDLPVTRDDARVYELKEALAKLPPNQRAAFVLQAVGGFSYAEIADRLELTVGSVQMLVFRARRQLRADLRGERRLVPAFLPLQAVANLLSRLSPAGDRAVLFRGAAGVAGAVALGGGILATPGAGSPPLSHVAKAPLTRVARSPAPSLSRAVPVRPVSRPATVARASVRVPAAKRPHHEAARPPSSPATPALPVPPAPSAPSAPAVEQPAVPPPPADKPPAKRPPTSVLPALPSAPPALPQLPELPQLPPTPQLPPSPSTGQVQPPTLPAMPQPPQLPSLPQLPALPPAPPILANS